MFVVAIVLFVLAVATAGSGIAAWSGRLSRDSGFGVRTEGSMRDDASFRAVNRAAGPSLVAAGVLLAVAGVAALAFSGLWGTLATVGIAMIAVVTAGAGSAFASRAAVPTATATASVCGQACGSCSLRDGCAHA